MIERDLQEGRDRTRDSPAATHDATIRHRASRETTMTRSVLVDSFKALASQLIVLHHLCLYSPMADSLAQAWPRLIALVVDDGRLAVQPFLVMGGFLAAQALHQRRDVPVPGLILQRYLRLAPPLACALLLVMAATVIVGTELAHEAWVSPLPGFSSVLVHLLLLQDVLGVPSVLAGAWYVAIDLQLFALFVVLMYGVSTWPPSRRDVVVPPLLAAATLASLFVFSRQPRLDIWAIYFLSAYGLGALAALSACSRSARGWWWTVVVLLLMDWWVEPRERPLWALATALALHAGWRWSWGPRSSVPGRGIRALSAWSYGVFVCHFALIILVSGLWKRFDLSGLPAALLACLLVVLGSMGLGAWVQGACDRLVRAMSHGGAIPRRGG